MRFLAMVEVCPFKGHPLIAVVKITLTKDDGLGYAPYILYLNKNIVFKGSSKQLGDWFAHEETSNEKYQFDGMRSDCARYRVSH
jgi:hypothetical protein